LIKIVNYFKQLNFNKMKKKIMVLSLIMALSTSWGLMNSANASGGWFWQSENRKCTVTKTFSIGWDYGVVLVSHKTESYEGSKSVCVDGNTTCWSSSCN
jgi:hypothetical protein